MKKTTILMLGACFAFLSCKKRDASPADKMALGSVPPIKEALNSWDPADASTAYAAFNNACYNSSNKLYYSTTLKDADAAIWTNAIFWDMAMDNYIRTRKSADLTRVTDMYTGGYNKYDHFNWNNTTVWFIYDDMMWWVMALCRANQLTGNATYLTTAQAGFDRVWNGSYDP
ncbi:MAG TPA: glycoside hydrolase family 76 protein, partial [Mucilaginibacter sp.]